MLELGRGCFCEYIDSLGKEKLPSPEAALLICYAAGRNFNGPDHSCTKNVMDKIRRRHGKYEWIVTS